MLLINKIIFLVLSVSLIVLFIVVAVKELRGTKTKKSSKDKNENCDEDFRSSCNKNANEL